LFAAARAPLEPARTEVLNMRVLPSDEVIRSLLEKPLCAQSDGKQIRFHVARHLE
jgi:hypothetical protein